MRGRNNRKGPNPLARVFESNGPDVKIRGTASHIMEKYLSLARDAQSSGDPVSAENYLQHAEHYYRIIAAAQGPAVPYESQPSFYQNDEAREDDWEGTEEGRFASSPEHRAVNGFAGQPNGGPRHGGPDQPYMRPQPQPDPAGMPQPAVPSDALAQGSEAAPAQTDLQPGAPGEGGFRDDGGFRRPRRRGRYQRGDRRPQAGETPASEPAPAD